MCIVVQNTDIKARTHPHPHTRGNTPFIVLKVAGKCRSMGNLPLEPLDLLDLLLMLYPKNLPLTPKNDGATISAQKNI